MKGSAVSLFNVSFSYGGDLSLFERVNIEIEKGEFLGIVGPNGGGKTTLLKLFMGFLTPQKGAVLIFGLQPQRSRLKIGYVPQIYRVDRDFPITVKELVLLGALGKGLTYPAEVKKRAEMLLEELGLSQHAHRPFSALSGGLAQRALFARALLCDPELLLLDEPMANVDTASSKVILDRLETLKGNKTILLITHDLRTVVEKVDRILCVQRNITSLQPHEICEHFALGLYHAPLIPLLPPHQLKGIDVPQCIPS